MKVLMLKTGILFLLLFMMEMGCKKKDTYDPDSIVGKWRWISTTGGVVGTLYPQSGHIVIARYTECSVLVTDNDSITFKARYGIIDDILTYYIDGDRVQITHKYKIESDTLTIIDLGYGMEGLYRRIH